MNASIISIGTELLSGRTVNTNSTEISKLLYLNDIDIIRSLSIHDTSADIKKALDYCLADSDLCILTGGLGPTNDDITKLSLCNYFDDELVLNETELDRLEQWFRKRNRVMSDVNRQQAYYPSKSRQFINDLGTASGILFEETDKIVISLPGVPHEMIHLMNNRVMPYLREKNPQRKDHHSLIFRLVNKAESDVFKILEDMIEHNKQISFAFYPNFMLLDLILSGPQKQLDQVAVEVLNRIGDHVYSRDEKRTLTDVIAEQLVKNQQTLTVAESCTGGLLSYFFTEYSGASAYFKGSIVSYSNEIKHSQLNVSADILEKFGAVSDECVMQMAQGAREHFNTDFSLSISGIAGPDGGTDDKPVGTVYLGFASASKSYSVRRDLGKGRHAIQNRAAQYAQYMLWKELMS